MDKRNYVVLAIIVSVICVILLFGQYWYIGVIIGLVGPVPWAVKAIQERMRKRVRTKNKNKNAETTEEFKPLNLGKLYDYYEPAPPSKYGFHSSDHPEIKYDEHVSVVCRQCGAATQFDIDSRKPYCSYCGSFVPEFQQMMIEHNNHILAMEREKQKGDIARMKAADTGAANSKKENENYDRAFHKAVGWVFVIVIIVIVIVSMSRGLGFR